MQSIKVITTGITILLGAFGGFILKIAPPSPDQFFISGVIGLSAVVIVFLFKALGSVVKKNRIMIISSAFLSFLLFNLFVINVYNYRALHRELVLNDTITCGDRSETISTNLPDSPSSTPTKKFLNDGIELENIWKRNSLANCEKEMEIKYYYTIMLFYLSLFLLIEITTLKKDTQGE